MLSFVIETLTKLGTWNFAGNRDLSAMASVREWGGAMKRTFIWDGTYTYTGNR